MNLATGGRAGARRRSDDRPGEARERRESRHGPERHQRAALRVERPVGQEREPEHERRGRGRKAPGAQRGDGAPAVSARRARAPTAPCSVRPSAQPPSKDAFRRETHHHQQQPVLPEALAVLVLPGLAPACCAAFAFSRETPAWNASAVMRAGSDSRGSTLTATRRPADPRLLGCSPPRPEARPRDTRSRACARGRQIPQRLVHERHERRLQRKVVPAIVQV